jgi:hypothetical protein
VPEQGEIASEQVSMQVALPGGMQLPHSFVVEFPWQINRQSCVAFPKQVPSQSLSMSGTTVVFPPEQTPQSSSVPLVLFDPTQGSPGAAQDPTVKRAAKIKRVFMVDSITHLPCHRVT